MVCCAPGEDMNNPSFGRMVVHQSGNICSSCTRGIRRRNKLCPWCREAQGLCTWRFMGEIKGEHAGDSTDESDCEYDVSPGNRCFFEAENWVWTLPFPREELIAILQTIGLGYLTSQVLTGEQAQTRVQELGPVLMQLHAPRNVRSVNNTFSRILDHLMPNFPPPLANVVASKILEKVRIPRSAQQVPMIRELSYSLAYNDLVESERNSNIPRVLDCVAPVRQFHAQGAVRMPATQVAVDGPNPVSNPEMYAPTAKHRPNEFGYDVKMRGPPTAEDIQAVANARRKAGKWKMGNPNVKIVKDRRPPAQNDDQNDQNENDQNQ